MKPRLLVACLAPLAVGASVAQLTDDAVQKLKNAPGAASAPPIPLQPYVPLPVPPLEVLPSYQPRPNQSILIRVRTARVHTRSGTQDKLGRLSFKLGEAGYRVCAIRVERISDIGNGNQWQVRYVAGQPSVGIRYLLKHRGRETDSSLAASRFRVTQYLLDDYWYDAVARRLADPTSAYDGQPLNSLIAEDIKCMVPRSTYRAGNHDFDAQPPPRREPPRPPPVQVPQVPQPTHFAYGRVECVESASGRRVGTSDHRVGAFSCEEARNYVRAYFSEKDRCRFGPSGTYPSWNAKPPIEWLQTSTCPRP
jgi:hypothetical protein